MTSNKFAQVDAVNQKYSVFPLVATINNFTAFKKLLLYGNSQRNLKKKYCYTYVSTYKFTSLKIPDLSCLEIQKLSKPFFISLVFF